MDEAMNAVIEFDSNEWNNALINEKDDEFE